MPFLPEVQESLKKIFLPSFSKLAPEDQAWVVMDVSPLLTGDAAKMDPEASNIGEANMSLIGARIRDWNFTEKDGTPIPISTQSIKRLKFEDFQALQDAIEKGEGELTDDEKKELSGTSLPSGTGESQLTNSL